MNKAEKDKRAQEALMRKIDDDAHAAARAKMATLGPDAAKKALLNSGTLKART